MKQTALPSASSPARKNRKEEVNDAVPVGALNRLADSYLISCEISQHSPQTVINRRIVLTKFSWFLTHKGLEMADVHSVRAFLHYVANGHKEPGGRWGVAGEDKPNKPGTVRTYYIRLQTFFNWLVNEGELEASPMQRISPPIDRPDQIQPFTEDQVVALFAAARKGKSSARDTALTYVLLDTGIRSSEAANLRLRDADLTGCQLRIREGKGGKGRTVPFSLETKRALYAYLRERNITAGDDDAPVFVAENGPNSGGQMSRSGLQQLFQRLEKESGVEGVRVSPHTFRHTFAIMFLRAGGNVFTLKTMLGHESLAMTNRYVAVAQADVTRQHAQFSPVARLKGGRLK